MSFQIKTTENIEDAAEFILLAIINKLKEGKHVLFFVTGGSSIAVAVRFSELLKEHPLKNLTQNLTIMLTDERYGIPGHEDSNWRQLIEKGFNIQGAKMIPILNGDDRTVTTVKFNSILGQEFRADGYKIGLFGIGPDGHTAGILPDSGAIGSENFAFSYNTPTFSRITITPKIIEKLDEVIAWVQGENKWSVLKDLEKNIDIIKQPAQILKKVPLLTIFTDYKNI